MVDVTVAEHDVTDRLVRLPLPDLLVQQGTEKRGAAVDGNEPGGGSNDGRGRETVPEPDAVRDLDERALAAAERMMVVDGDRAVPQLVGELEHVAHCCPLSSTSTTAPCRRSLSSTSC